MQRSSYRILSYKIKHNYNIKDFLISYSSLLQKSINIIWNNIQWIKKQNRVYPIVPKSNEFKRNLRNTLLSNWDYASHYVDSAIKVSYSILDSWKRNYVKKIMKKNKPIVKRKFIRVKETLYSYRNGKIRVTIKPRELYLEFDLSRAWFKKRVNGYDLGELILKENELIITFKIPIEDRKTTKCIGWDLNKYSLDGFSPRYGWIKIDLSKLYHIHRIHEVKIKKAQSIVTKKPSVKLIVSKHGEREKNRSKDFVHKLTTELAKKFPNAIHGFEDLEKQGMYNHSRKHNRDISKQNWKQIVQYMEYKSRIKLVNPRNTSSTCPICGGRLIKLQKGQVVRCPRCGLTLDRQLCGAMNIYLNMCGFPQSPSNFFRLVLRPLLRSMKKRRMQMRTLGGVTTKGDKGCDILPMNPEEVEPDESQGLCRIKNYVS